MKKNVKQQTLKQKKKKPIAVPYPAFSHDSLFKHFYSDPKLVKDLFQLVFSKQTMKALNWNKLKIEKDTFEGKRADLIFSIPLKAYPKIKFKIFILLEHKAYYDKALYNQCLGYQTLMRAHQSKHLGSPMPIIPVLFYHGKKPLKWSKTLQEEDFSKDLYKLPLEFRKVMLNYGIKIVDARSAEVKKAYKKLKSRGVIKLLSEVWELRNPSPEKLKNIFLEFKDILKVSKGEQKKDTVLKILEYLRDNTGFNLKSWGKAEELILDERILTKGGVMDIREHIKEKGRWEGMQEGMRKGIQKGREEGLQQVVLNMLKEKTDINFISKVTGLPKDEIKKLKNGF